MHGGTDPIYKHVALDAKRSVSLNAEVFWFVFFNKATAVFCLEQQNLKEKREIHATEGIEEAVQMRGLVFSRAG